MTTDLLAFLLALLALAAAGLTTRLALGFRRRPTVPYLNRCPHGHPWDDCPACRH